MARLRSVPGRTGLALAILVLGTTAPAASAGQHVHVVSQLPAGCPGAPAGQLHTTVQAAVTAADAGDRVLVCPGVYAEGVTIDDSITLQSIQGPATTVLAASGDPSSVNGILTGEDSSVVAIAAPKVVVGGYGAGPNGQPLGFTLRPRSVPVPLRPEVTGHGIESVAVEIVAGSTDAVVAGNVVSGFTEVGISIAPGAHRASILRNELTQASLPASAITTPRTFGIAVNTFGPLADTNGVEIAGNRITAPPGTGAYGVREPEETATGRSIGSAIATLGPGSGTRVASNTIVGRFAHAIQLKLFTMAPYIGTPPPGASLTGPQVTDNTIEGAGSGSGIQLATDPDPALAHVALSIVDAGVTGNKVQGVERGIELTAGVEHAKIHGNSLSVESAGGAAPAAIDVSANRADIHDPTTGGIYAFTTRNLIYDNACFKAAVETTHDKPPSVCDLSTPPTVTGLITDGAVVAGIPEMIGGWGTTGALGSVRLAVGEDGRELGDYEDPSFSPRHAVEFESRGTYKVSVQARNATDPAIGPRKEFDVAVEENAPPSTRAPSIVSLHEDLEGDAPGANQIVLEATQDQEEAAESVTLKVTAKRLEHGTLVGLAADGATVADPAAGLTYVPDPGETTPVGAPDSFAFKACDGFPRLGSPDGCTDAKVVEISVVPVDDPPTAADGVAQTHEDEPVTIALPGTDSDSASLRYRVRRARGGTVELRPSGQAVYTPRPDWHGSDSFEYTVNDELHEAHGRIDVTVAPVNDAPTAAPASARVAEGGEVVIDLVGADADGDALSFAIRGPAEHGTVEIEGSQARYSAADGYSGADSFLFEVVDPAGASAEAAVAIEIAASPAPPVEEDADTVDPAPPEGADQPLPPRESGQQPPSEPVPASSAGVAEDVRGAVFVGAHRAPGLRLRRGEQLGERTVIDAHRGRVTIKSGSQTVSVSRGAFVLATRRDASGAGVLVLRLVRTERSGPTLRLRVSGNCRCDVVTRDATIRSSGKATWLTEQDAAATRVKLSSGAVWARGRRAGCRFRALRARQRMAEISRRGRC